MDIALSVDVDLESTILPSRAGEIFDEREWFVALKAHRATDEKYMVSRISHRYSKFFEQHSIYIPI